MTASSKDIASFFENGTTDQFEYCFKLYPEVLKLKAEKRGKKPQELIRLDEWYQNELPKLIKARGKDKHLVYDELCQTMKWKQTRGKFYPQLSYLVKVNTPRAVMQETKKAFRKLPNLEQAITALSNLKGVGTTMASALLAAAAPDLAPFMADECLMAIPEIEGIDYTTKEYLNFVHHIQSTVTRLNTEAGGETPHWSPHRVELALWAHYVANDLNPELLEDMPGPGSAANTNGSSAAGKIKPANMLDGGGGDDTNDAVDADDESLGAAAGRGGEPNNTATESETENENTNPPPTTLQMATTTGVSAATAVTGILQDGDSNFVSNDSTSHEPIIDENTTQTTATTSTDDGEVGTPHGSDSDSYIAELPILDGLTGMPAVAIVAPILLSGSSSNNAGNANINNSKSATSITAAATASTTAAVATAKVVGNGNGALLLGAAAVSAGTSADDDESIDGDINNCLQRTSANEVEASDDDEEDDEIDEDDSNNSNSHHGHKSVTPIINLNDGPTNTNTNTDNDSTLSSAGIVGGIAQKRSMQCVGGGAADVVEDANSQPEMKKIKSD